MVIVMIKFNDILDSGGTWSFDLPKRAKVLWSKMAFIVTYYVM